VITVKKTDLEVISSLRKNARETLTNISRTKRIPVSTIFDKIRVHRQGIIKKYTTIVDFNELGYSARAKITIKAKPDARLKLKSFLMIHPNVNSLYRINNGYDFLVETIFKNILELEEFIESVEKMVKVKQVYYVIEDLKREEFLAS